MKQRRRFGGFFWSLLFTPQAPSHPRVLGSPAFYDRFSSLPGRAELALAICDQAVSANPQPPHLLLFRPCIGTAVQLRSGAANRTYIRGSALYEQGSDANRGWGGGSTCMWKHGRGSNPECSVSLASCWDNAQYLCSAFFPARPSLGRLTVSPCTEKAARSQMLS